MKFKMKEKEQTSTKKDFKAMKLRLLNSFSEIYTK